MTFRRPRALLVLLCASLLASPVGASNAAPRAPGDDAASLLLLPIRVHLLQAEEAPELQCGLTETEIRRIVGKVQAIWRPAGIHFYLESIVREAAVNQRTLGTRDDPWNLDSLLDVRPPASLADGVIHVYYLHQMAPNGVWLQEAIFVKDTAKLREVEGGIDEPLPRVTAHELGHALGLPHRQDETNLMASGTTGTSLNEREIARARAQALLALDAKSPAELFAAAESLAKRGDRAAARRLYAHLALLPIDCEPKRIAARRLHPPAARPRTQASPTRSQEPGARSRERSEP